MLLDRKDPEISAFSRRSNPLLPGHLRACGCCRVLEFVVLSVVARDFFQSRLTSDPDWNRHNCMRMKLCSAKSTGASRAGGERMVTSVVAGWG